MSKRQSLLAILVIRIGISLLFTSEILVWEKLDELHHYKYAKFIATEKRLPRPSDYPDYPPNWRIMIQHDQPPLYYTSTVPLIWLFDDQDVLSGAMAMPPETCKVGVSPFFIHNAPPITTKNDIIWFIRFYTMCLTLVGIYITWETVRYLYPANFKLANMTAFFLAFMPSSIEVSLWMNNDAPLLLGGACALYCASHVWRNDKSTRYLLLYFLTLGLSLFVKLNAIALFPLGIVLIGKYLTQKFANLPRQLVALLILIGVIGFLAIFFSINYTQCESLFCRIHQDSRPSLVNPIDEFKASFQPTAFGDAISMFTRTLVSSRLYQAFTLPLWMIAFGNIIFIVGLVGEVRHMRAYWDTISLGMILFLSALILGLSRVVWLKVGYFPARYIVVAFPAIAFLVVYGYSQFNLTFIPIIGIAVFMVLSLGHNYLPLGTKPPIVNNTQIPSSDIDIQFESGILVRTIQIDNDGLYLYLSRSKNINEPMYIIVKFYDATGQIKSECGQVVGTGFYPPTRWQENEIIVQYFSINPLSEKAGNSIKIDLYYLQNHFAFVNDYDPYRPDQTTDNNIISVKSIYRK